MNEDIEYNESELGNIEEGEVAQVKKVSQSTYLRLSADSNEDIKNKVSELKVKTGVELRLALRMIVTNCLAYADKGVMNIHYSRFKASKIPKNMNKNNITVRMVIKAVDVLESLGYVINTVADRQYNTLKMKESSYITPTAKLFEDFGCEGNIAYSKKSIRDNTEVVILKNEDGDMIDYKDNCFTSTTRGMLQFYNTTSAKFSVEVDGAKLNTDMRCIFKIDFDSYGRMYGGSYQNMPKELRLRVMIDGCACAEIDLSNLHLRMVLDIYNLNHYCEHIEDLYMLPLVGFIPKEDDRKLVKKAILIMLNCNSSKSFLQAIQGDMNMNGYVTTFSSAKQLLGALNQAYWWLLGNEAVMKNIFGGNKPLAAKLQRLDTEISLGVSVKLAELNVMVGTIHDSYLCKQSDVLLVSNVLGDVYRRVMNVNRRVAATLSYGDNVITTLI